MPNKISKEAILLKINNLIQLLCENKPHYPLALCNDNTLIGLDKLSDIFTLNKTKTTKFSPNILIKKHYTSKLLRVNNSNNKTKLKSTTNDIPNTSKTNTVHSFNNKTKLNNTYEHQYNICLKVTCYYVTNIIKLS